MKTRIKPMFAEFLKYPSLKTTKLICSAILTDRRRRNGEAEMARREKARKRPVTFRQVARLARQISGGGIV